MSRRREWILIACVALAAAAAGYAYNAWRTAPAQSASDEGLAALRAARLPDLEGNPQALEQWRGKVVVVNFWATWCAPCREEIPGFIALQNRYGARGLQFVGIAIDQAEKVRPYAAELGMNFPVLVGGADAIALTRSLGNRAGVLPYTIVLDRDGKAVKRKVGAVKEAEIERLIVSLL